LERSPRDGPQSDIGLDARRRLHAGELFVHQSLRDWPVLRRELLNFRPEITRTGVETWNARSGEHDDCVLSLAMAIWYLGNPEPWSGYLRYYALMAGAVAGGSRWVLSTDIGQAIDPSAITLVEKIENPGADDTRAGPFIRETVSA
jgi:hypothetical protein